MLVHKANLEWGRKTLFLGLILIVVYLILSVFANNGSSNASTKLLSFLECSEKWRTINLINVDEDNCPNAIEVVLNVSGIDPISVREIRGNISLYPQGNLGQQTLSGGVFDESVQINTSSLTNNEVNIPSNTFSIAYPIQISMQEMSNLQNYPFDDYSGSLSVYVKSDVTGEPIPSALTISENVVPGYNLDFESTESENQSTPKDLFIDGILQVDINIHRSLSDKTMVLVLVLITLIGLLSSVIVSVSIYKRNRPPSLGALAWNATFLFALIQVRAEFPGEPPLGIKLDNILTFPSIGILIGLIVLNSLSWIKREDWDMENRSVKSN